MFPVSLIYALVVHVRNWLYDIQIFQSKSYTTPIICVGNLSVGGTGKTPMVELLISFLRTEYKVAVLSRGYRRKTKGFILADDDTSVEAIGDEPFQIRKKFPDIAVAVDTDRQNGITILEQNIRPDIILLDDAFQHRRVKCGFSILLTAYGNLYADDWYLPTGNLRDSKREARRANLIVVTKCPRDLEAIEKDDIKQKLNLKSHQKLLFAFLNYGSLLIGAQNNISLDSLKDKSITLVTGIADPEPLVTHLKENGLIFEHLRFKDHHYFTETELDRLRKKKYILTTEKDYVRLQHKLENILYIPVAHQFFKENKGLLEKQVENFMKPHS